MGAHSAVWQGYIDSNFMPSGQFDKFAILSYNLAELEASTPDYKLSPADVSAIANAFANVEATQTQGLSIQGEDFKYIFNDDRSIYLRKGKLGLVLVKTKSCVFVGHHGENVVTQAAGNYLQGMADWINKS